MSKVTMQHKRPRTLIRRLGFAAAGITLLWLVLEAATRAYVEYPLETDFYGSLPRDMVKERQAEVGLRTLAGPGWVHLGWIADIDNESYRVESCRGKDCVPIAVSRFGSVLLRGASGTFRVTAVSLKSGPENHIIGEATIEPLKAVAPPVLVPRVSGPYKTVFQPRTTGSYINDHTIFRDALGRWRLIGITSKSKGDFNQERYFATAVSADFPPENGMDETEPLADFGELAWAPHVIQARNAWHIFWSPHKLYQMDSKDGITWGNFDTTMSRPYHKFFRDGMVLEAAPGHWLLYATARGRYFSRIDVYQSFNLREWQYIGAGLDSGPGSERNSPFGSFESPFVANVQGRYYLAATYNNDSFFYPGILLMFHIWPGRESYNDTMVFHADNPFEFGTYTGRRDSTSLLTRLNAHAAEFIYVPEKKSWYITTAGWPWVSTLTHGEVAAAPLTWSPQ